MAHWHGLAKLRMHSDLTLEIMDGVTSAVGQQFREFKASVCAAYTTHELRREVEARTRRQLKQAAKQNGVRIDKQRAPAGTAPNNVKRMKVFNLQTYKFHALGDYVSTIRQYGTSDSYSSEPVRVLPFVSGLNLLIFQGELEHRSPKARYRRTDRKLFVKQLTRIERRQARIRRVGDRIAHRPHIEITELARNPDSHHHIGLTQKYPVHIGSYLRMHEGDPATKVSRNHTCANTLTYFCRILCRNSNFIYCVGSRSREI